VLFGGENSDAWESASGGPVHWKVVAGELVVAPNTGDIRTKDKFGDIQLHLAFRTPKSVSGSGQDRGNSGVYLMSRYELQILDSYQNPTYVNGQAAAIYKQYAPLVNASRPPREWQTYDVLFYAPHFAAPDRRMIPARMTVFHNGVLVQNDVALLGSTIYQGRPSYKPHADKLPLLLQDHGSEVAFRNIWVREISRPAACPP
jgi:hypothetical protein